MAQIEKNYNSKNLCSNREHKLLAHVKQNEMGKWEIHTLKDHLEGVAKLAERFASKFNSEDWLKATALLHDLGKISGAFQRKIKRNSGYDVDAFAKEGDGNAPHAIHGAYWAYTNWDEFGKIISYLIAGHHGGLPDWSHEIGIGGNLETRLSKDEIKKLPELVNSFWQSYTENIKKPNYVPSIFPNEDYEQIHLWIRILYSCLVDADFLDTEKFMNLEKFNSRKKFLSVTDLKQKFDKHMGEIKKGAMKTPVNNIRNEVLCQCRNEAKNRPGLFSLTVPTGGGKTLSSMAFALEHATEYNKDRIIMVIPYTSIIEQTAETYKSIFGDKNVIEHHSSLDPDNETLHSRLASENWDAPIIVTTTVQFFESLFASRSSACRKLHNIVNSVVIVDEAQMLPTDFLKPILHSIYGLTKYFDVSMVLCTATQPAITSKIFPQGDGRKYAILKDDECREIMISPSPNELTEKLQRVDVKQIGKVEDWNGLIEKLKNHNTVLCIVNTRNDCRELFEAMSEGTVHLSANMCGEHRSHCIGEIKDCLKNGRPIRVVSTQLVEAGVDFDFPVVYRAMAGFDSIAQAAGRCNREGELVENGVKVKGKVFVFEPPKSAPKGALLKGASNGKKILDIDSDGCKNLLPETFRKYFELYFSDLNTFDKQNMEELLVKDATDFNFQFRTAAHKFNMIDNQRQISIVVWYPKMKDYILSLINTLRFAGPNRDLMRKLQRFTITIPENVFAEVAHSFEDINGIWCQDADTLYDEVLGFVGYNGELPIL